MATLGTISGFSFSSRSRLSLLLKISRLNIDTPLSTLTLNKCSSKAFIYLTFIIYYISQKRSRILTLIDQYFLNSKKHPETSGCHSYIKYKIASVRRLARSPTPQKKKSTFHSLQGFPLPDNPPSSKW